MVIRPFTALHASADAPRAAVLSLSDIASDPRVRRQCRALSEAGWRVTSVAFGHGERADPWRHRSVPALPFDARPLRRAARVAGLLATRLTPAIAFAVWRAQPRHQALLRACRDLSADLVIANDYTSLPAALDLVAGTSAALVYDAHEFSVGERAEDPVWRLLYPPFVAAIEGAGLLAAQGCCTVSDGIARLMQARHNLPRRPTVARNVPAFRSVPAHPTGERLLVHHHGALAPERGIELMIRSVPLWEPRFSLRIVGPAEEAYRRRLHGTVAELGIGDRVRLEPAVPPDQMIPVAAEADIGLMLTVGGTPQLDHSLPNKLFEYVMAGLALVVTDLPDAAGLVRARDLGRVLPAPTPEALAGVINGLDREAVAEYRRRALEAARDLCWEAESAVFLDLCTAALASRKGGAAALRPPALREPALRS
jgi:glycogen synthase